MTLDEKLKIIGAKIVYYRMVKGYNQKQFADKLSISWQYLSKVEKGDNACSLPLLNIIAEALDIKISDLIDGI